MAQHTASQIESRIQFLKDQIDRVSKDITEAAHDHNVEGRVTYLELQNRRNSLESRLSKAVEELKNFQKASSSNVITDKKASPGSKVRLSDRGIEFEARLVDSPNSMYVERMISVNSPMGKALNGRNIGESFGVSTPNGTKSYKLVDVLV